jgi:Xaa-Pro aminopeptidase
MTEFRLKLTSMRDLLEQHKLQSLLLQRVSSFAWATCGAASYVNTAATFGTATLLVTRNRHYLITNNIEAPRYEKEEKLNYQGWQFEIDPWYAPTKTLGRLVGKGKVGADFDYPGALDLSAEITQLRTLLTAEENVRFRVLGRLCAEAMDSAIRAIQPGQTEHQIAARLGFEVQSRGVQPIVNLIATDDRIFNYRHPLPTYKTLDRYAMLVICGRRWGLIASLTRLVHFGPIPEDVRRKAAALARIDATFIDATRPGTSLGQIFQRAVQSYADTGYPGEWQFHHQGGPAAYEPREYIATPTSTEKVVAGQVYAWNPSISGCKSEDTIQVGEESNEIITAIPGWPASEIEIDGHTYSRPSILEVD